MPTKLSLYNGALRILGENKLANLTEGREPRFLLDDVYDDAVLYCLEEGQWNFAQRTIQIDSDSGATPAFGYAYAFVKPDDWVRTTGLSADEYLRIPLTNYEDGLGYWFADVDPLYVRYVSNDPGYGLNLAGWPQSFTEFVELHLASKIIKRLTQSTTDEGELKRDLRRAKRDALAKDAMNDPTKFLPPGSWTSSRMQGNWRNRRYQRG